MEREREAREARVRMKRETRIREREEGRERKTFKNSVCKFVKVFEKLLLSDDTWIADPQWRNDRSTEMKRKGNENLYKLHSDHLTHS